MGAPPVPTPSRQGFVQGYNAQVAATRDDLIAAVHLGQSPNDMSSSSR
jgi:hypothetical protein